MAESQTDEQKAAAAKAAADKAAAAKKAAEDKKAKEAADKKAAADAKKASGKRFFTSHLAGLTVYKEDGTSVRFTPYYDKFQGDDVRVGYFETDDQEVIDRLTDDANVEEIEKSEFTKKTEKLRTAPVYSV